MKFLKIYILFLFLNFLQAKEIEFYLANDILSLGDTFYAKKQYDRSVLFYEAYKQYSSLNAEVHSKLILNYVRLKENHYKIKEENLKELLDQSFDSFIYNYISLYGSLRFGYFPLSFSKIYKIENSRSSQVQKEYAKLIFGGIYLEEDYSYAKKYYETLYIQTSTEEIKKITKEIVSEIENFHQTFNPKRPLLAGVLSILLPGAGYVYTHHYVDGIFSFFWNSVFLGGGIYLYNLEKQTKQPHTISGLFLIFGVGFYITNILGSYTSAIRYNNYHIRIFYQKLRNLYFNTDFIEKTSGVEFQIRF